MTLQPTMAQAVRAALTVRWNDDAFVMRSRLAVAGLVAVLLATPAWTAGLGDIRVQSALGQPLRASVTLLGDDAGSKLGTCFSARLNTPDGAFIVAPRIAIAANAGVNGVLNLSTTMAMSEPAIALIVEVGCGDSVRKDFSLLLDPPLYLPGSSLAGAEAPQRTGPVAATNTARSSVRRRDTDATDAANATNARAAAPRDSSTSGTPPPAIRTRLTTPRPKAVAAAPPVAAKRFETSARASITPPKNILRIGARDGNDVDLVNAIGLRLAMADRLAEDGAGRKSATAAGTLIPDLAKSSADRAAQARFAAALRDQPDTGAGATSQATERKLEALQAKLQILEAEAEKMRLSAARNVAGPGATAAATTRTITTTETAATNWLPILGAVLAVALLVIGWLLQRMKRLQHDHASWDWKENVSAADSRVGNAGFEPFGATGTAAFAAAPDPLEPMPASTAFVASSGFAASPADTFTGLSRNAPSTMQAAARTAPEPQAPALVPADTLHEFNLDAPTISAPVNPGATTAGLAEGLGMTAGAMATGQTIYTTHATHTPQSAYTTYSGATGTPNAAPAQGGMVDDAQRAKNRSQQPAVEEISDAMQEAEFWISLHDSQRAVEVLEPYATGDQPGSPLPWLYLFDLYRELGQRTKYELLHERFRHNFNGRIQTWLELDGPPVSTPPRSLEDMPHMSQKIAALWQSDNIVPYLESLLLDDRDGTRVGFDLPVYREIMFLITMAYELQKSKRFIKPAIGTPGWTLAA